MSLRWAVLIGAAGLVLTACGGDPTRGIAAEPAQAPEATRPPAGRVVEVGRNPEGLVADAATGLVAVAVREPARLVLLDGDDGAVRTAVPLRGTLRHLQLAAPGGPVLVPVEQADELVRVTLPGGGVSPGVRTGRGPHDAAAAANGLVFVADEFGATVTVIDGGRAVATLPGPVQPGGIAAAGNLVGLIDVAASTLIVYDATTRTAAEPVSAGGGPTHLVADLRGRFILTDTRGDALLVFEPGGREPVSSTPLPGRPYGIAHDAERDRVWVTLTDRNELVGFDLASGTPVEVVRVPTVRQPNTVAVDGRTGRVFVAGAAEGVLQLYDPPA